MTKFLKKVVILSVLLVSADLFAQDDLFNKNQEKAFHPKFTLGSGIYTLTGDIQNEEKGLLKGREGFNAGMKFELVQGLDISFLFIKTSFSADVDERFYSDVDGFGIHLGYTLNNFLKKSKISPVLSLGVQRLGVLTTINDEKQERASAITAPLFFGLRMDVTERLQFDVGINFGIGMQDIDMSEENQGNSDGYKSLNFAVHYDLFTPGDNSDNYFDDSYYEDVDFAKLESHDEDGDLVPDMDDYCPKTPIGVKVDKNGCPIDSDKDGIPDYLDQQKNTPQGSIVDEYGVRLTAEKYKSIYSDLEIASRRYANFYNEEEIKREDYKTIDEYLIAKANAFNKAFNESLDDDVSARGLVYRVKIGEFLDGIPAKIANKLLSIEDLQSFTMDNDAIIYSVGTYPNLNDAINRLSSLEDKGFDDTYIIVDNNGEISNYVEASSVEVLDDYDVVNTSDEVAMPPQEQYNVEEGIAVEQLNEPVDETTYRIQIGAFSKPLSEKVFVGVKNVVSFIGKDKLIRYMTGSFVDYKDAVDYQAQMQARGFEDAFIVTYKNGERISLNLVLKNQDEVYVAEQEENSDDMLSNLKFTVQIMVSETSVSADDLNRMGQLGNIDKQAKGADMYEYYAGTYIDIEEASTQLEKAKIAGFSDAFIFATKDGRRISLKEAQKIIEKGK